MSANRLSWLATFESAVPANAFRFWLGQGDLTFGGEVYQGVSGPNGAALEIGQMLTGTDFRSERLTIRIATDTDAARQWARQDYGPMKATVEWISSADYGATWTSTGRAYVGRISNGDLDVENNVFSAEIEPQAGLVDWSLPEQWDHASQQQRHPGDLGFAFQDDLASGIDIRWP